MIKHGKLPENRIVYKFLNDTLSILINPRHKYDDDVLEFFNTIQHLDGKATVNFLRGPMGHEQGRGTFTSAKDIKLNLGGPSESTRNKKGGYTISNGIVKHILLRFLTLASQPPPIGAEPLVVTDKVKIIPVVYQNDSTALKPSLMIDQNKKAVVRIRDPTT